MKIEATLIIANQKNLNGRIYPSNILDDIVNQFHKSNKPMFGELGHPDGSSIVSLQNVSHKVNSIRIKKDRLPRKNKKLLKKQGLYENCRRNTSLVGCIELLNTSPGKLAKKMFKNKTAVVRPRGIGTINEKSMIENYSIISFDIINKSDDAFSGL